MNTTGGPQDTRSGAGDPAPPALVMPGRRVRTGEGAAWIAGGWRLFRKATVMWVVFLVLFFLLHMGLGFVPYAGSLLGSLATPLLLGGVALGCRSLETGGDLELEHLLAGFRRNTGYLFAIGVLYAFGELALLAVMGAIAGFPLVGAVLSGDAESMVRALNGLDVTRVEIGALVALVLAVPLMAALWFAPALAMLHGVPALAAMIPFLLGLLAWLPLAIATAYASYRSIFTKPDDFEA